MRWLAVLAVVMLSACVPGQGASDLSSAAPEASPLAAAVIETTSLDVPAAQPAPAPDEAAPAVPEATEEVAPTLPASPEEACVTLTRDGGKACTRQSQCEGYCLARSGTCAPITPMFGCNDILQDDGREVTLCLD
jgi:hypothetical protein